VTPPCRARIFPCSQRGLREQTEPHRRAVRPRLGSEWPSGSVWANLVRSGSVSFYRYFSVTCLQIPPKPKCAFRMISMATKAERAVGALLGMPA